MDTGEILPPGERGERVYTTLRKHARPLIRFRTGDIGRFVTDKCACGRTLGRIYVDGRKDDMFIVSAVNVYPSDIEFVVRGLEGVTGEYLIRITEENFTARYEVTIEKSHNNPEQATGYGLWVRSIRTAEGAIQFPTPEQARRHVWSDADRELVADRIDTQFVGAPGQVADQLERLRDATEADELIITTITHDHADRVRSYQLLAEEWARR